MADEQVNTADPEVVAVAAGTNPNAGAAGDPPPVKTAEQRINELTSTVEQQKAQTGMLQQQLLIYQNNPHLTEPPKPPQTILEKYDLEADEPIDGEQLQNILASEGAEMMASISTIQFLVQNPDFSEVVGVAGKVAAPLEQALKDNPDLYQILKTSPQPHVLAYSMAKPYAALAKGKADKKPTTEAEKIAAAAIANSTRPGSASSVSGPGAVGAAGQYAKMSDDELEKRIEEVKARG